MASTPSANIQINLTSSCPDVSNAASQLNPTIVYPTDGSSLKFPFINGSSGAGKIQYMHVAADSVTAGTPLNLNLNSGLTDPCKNAVAMTLLMGLMIVNRSLTAANVLQVGNAASNGFFDFLDSATSYLKVGAGATVGGVNIYGFGMLVCPNGYTITPTTHVNLAFNAAAGTIPFDVWAIGQ